MDILHRELSYLITGYAMAVHNCLGCGVDESFYHKGLRAHLEADGVPFQYKPRYRLVHQGILADRFEPDLIVDNRIIVELKRLQGAFAPAHYSQLVTYLKFCQIQLGLLFDFGKESLIKDRFVYTDRPISVDSATLCDVKPTAPQDLVLFDQLCAAIATISEQYRLGYRDTTYRGLLRAELLSQRVPVQVMPKATIWSGNRKLGIDELDCLVVGDRCVLKVVAMHERLRPLHRATVQSYLKHLKLPWGLLVNFGKQQLKARYVWNAKCQPQPSPPS